MRQKGSQGRKKPKLTKWQIYKRLKGITKRVSATIKWDLLPAEVGIRILAFLQVRDLVRFCSVCKNWRDIILFSQYFKELHSRLCPPQKCIVCFPEYEPGEKPHLSHSCIEYFYVSGTTLLGLHHPGLVFANDGGFLCMCRMQDGNLTYEVGNPLLNSWKTIPSPSDDLVPTDMIVDKSSGAYMILALGPKSDYAEVYDSRKNQWRKGGTVDCSGVPHNELIGTSSIFFSFDDEDKVAIYDYVQDRSSWVNFDYPNESYEFGNYTCFVSKCKDRMILVGLAQREPKIELWSGSTLNGTLKWTLMTELDAAALKQLIAKTNPYKRENEYIWVLNYFPEEWYPKVALGEHDSILIGIAGAEKCEEDETLLLEYDLAKCLWKPIKIPDTLYYFPDNSSKESLRSRWLGILLRLEVHNLVKGVFYCSTSCC